MNRRDHPRDRGDRDGGVPQVAQLIGELLVRAKALTPADLEEAVGWQVLYGGRLGTNLLELGVVDERELAEALGRQHGCEYAWGELDLPESMVQMIPAVLARRHEIVPWKLDGRKLKVLTSHPSDAMSIIDELGFRTGKVVRPVVAPEFRVHQLLRRHFQSVRPMRALDFGQKVARRPAARTSAAVRPEPVFGDGGDLMDDEQFAALYSHAIEGRGASAPPGAVERDTPVPAVQVQARAVPPIDAASTGAPATVAPSTGVSPTARPDTPPVLIPSRLVSPAPAGELAGIPSPPVSDTDEAIEEDEEILEGEILEDEHVEALDEPDFLVALSDEEDGADEDPGRSDEESATDSAMKWAEAFQELERELAATAEVTEPVRDTSPLSFNEAVEAIAQADGREEVARAVLRYARSRAARAVLLSVQGNVALGWDAVGEDLSPEVARRIAFPLTSPSAFRLVRQSRSHYIGPLGKEPGNVRFLKLAGKKWPASAVLLPVLFRGRVVYVLYVDNGHRKHVDADVGELLILSQNITRSMESLVSRRQHGGGAGR